MLVSATNFSGTTLRRAEVLKAMFCTLWGYIMRPWFLTHTRPPPPPPRCFATTPYNETTLPKSAETVDI